MNSIRIFSGRWVDPFNLQPGDICIESIVHSLSLLNRFTGHTIFPYSVAQHSVLLCENVPDHLCRAALLHDMNESLMNDIPRPFKSRLTQYTDFEDIVQREIFKYFDEPWENMVELQPYDKRILQDEMSQLFTSNHDFGVEPLGVFIKYWDWKTAKSRYMDKCKNILE